MAIDSKSSWPPLVAALASLLLAVFFIWLAGARFQHQKGLNLLEAQQSDWPAARARLLQAAADYGVSPSPTTAPWYVPADDTRRLYTTLGESFLAEAATAPETTAIFAALKNAETQFRAALRLQPLSVSAQIGLAQTTAALERGFAWLAPGKKNPYQAAPEFEKLLRLRPNGIEAHFLFIRYLNGTGQDRLQELTRHLAAIAPQTADALRRDLSKRQDWRDKLEPALTEGLRAAIAADNKPVVAYRALSLLAEGHGDFPAAINYLLRAVAATTADGGNKPAVSWDYSRLAGLYLRQNDADAAQRGEQAALKALRSSASRDQTLRELWRIYKENKRFRPFLDLLAAAEKTMRLPEARRIVQAACLVELGDTAAAQASLVLVKEPQYQAEALRFLAELARREQNWDAMELAAQRATVIEPKNSSNFYLFAQSLRPQKKYRQAAAAMDQAIAAAAKEDPWLYNFRAWNRWNDDQLEAARADWLKAIKLLPNNAELYRALAMTYEKEGAKLQAIATMKKAAALAPGNADFTKKLQELQK